VRRRAMKFSFVFVCQQGRLEIEALLLAWSLRRFATCSYEMLIAVPRPASIWGEPAESTLSALVELGGEIRHIENHFDTAYPIANKLSCLGLEVGSDVDKRVFLDSDMLLVREFDGKRPELARTLCATPERSATWSSSVERWKELYGMFGLEVPATRVRATVSGEVMPPYFNAGFIAVDPDLPLAEVWLDTCRKIGANPDVKRKRPWLDQAALPVAAARLGVEISALSEAYNFPVNRKHLDTRRPPFLSRRPPFLVLRGGTPFVCHYHRTKFVQRVPLLRRQAELALSEVEGLRELVAEPEEWRGLLVEPPKPREVQVEAGRP
jgi:hypothetical protein